ncbi:MAG TPA: hypothetical protein VHP83_00360 [Aggregatilineaceae bacterium]|nr:hypothetical protein [Aggregatilineaceae bacterium]
MHQGYEAAWFALPQTAENTDFILDDMKGLAPLLPTTRPKRNDP